ncbi:phosphotransferase [Shewanella sp. YIC-542]|uniref:phosphotransferase n=1 Tax=Shewanella mytili TaxID=3377111 RepID=UPI00398E5FCA
MLASLAKDCGISQSLAEAIAQALRQLALPAPERIAPQSLGLSNQSFRLQFQHNALLLRLNSPVTDKICNRDNEIACWQAAQHAGLAPEIYWVDPQKRFYLSEWISESASGLGAGFLPWQQLQMTEKCGTASLMQLAVDTCNARALYPAQKLLQLLQGLQQLAPPKLDISLQKQWRIYLTRLQKMADAAQYAGAGSPAASAWLTRLQWLEQVALDGRFNRLDDCLLAHQYCHRDLSAHNLLLHNDQLYCIDFEYCCSSHPLFELAGVIACHQLQPAARQWLVDEYLTHHPHLRADAKSALPAALDIFWLYSCAWALQMADSPSTDGQVFFSWFDNYRQLLGKG